MDFDKILHIVLQCQIIKAKINSYYNLVGMNYEDEAIKEIFHREIFELESQLKMYKSQLRKHINQ